MPDSTINGAPAPAEEHNEQNADKKEDGQTRRQFVQASAGLMAAGYAGALGYPVYRYLTTPARRAAASANVSNVELPDADKLEPGTALMFKFGVKPAMLIRHEDGSWSAFSAVCTHLGCTVSYEHKQSRIFCACHGGVYDPKTGANVDGPPPTPLDSYTVEVSDGKVVVSRA